MGPAETQCKMEMVHSGLASGVSKDHSKLYAELDQILMLPVHVALTPISSPQAHGNQLIEDKNNLSLIQG